MGREWLRSYESAFEAHPQAAFFGAPVRLRFIGEPPRWLREGIAVVGTAFARVELPTPVPPVDARSRRLPVGANMAIRSAEQRRHAYDARLGRQPWRHGIRSGEETDVLARIAEGGGIGVWLPEPGVDHWIGPERQTLEYLRGYYVGIGYRDAWLALAKGRALGRSWRMQARLAGRRAVYVAQRLRGGTAQWLVALRRREYLRGRLLAARDALVAGPGFAAAR
jgi:hypothetical protein